MWRKVSTQVMYPRSSEMLHDMLSYSSTVGHCVHYWFYLIMQLCIADNYSLGFHFIEDFVILYSFCFQLETAWDYSVKSSCKCCGQYILQCDPEGMEISSCERWKLLTQHKMKMLYIIVFHWNSSSPNQFILDFD